MKRPVVPQRKYHMVKCAVCVDAKRERFETPVERTTWITRHRHANPTHRRLLIWDEWMEVRNENER